MGLTNIINSYFEGVPPHEDDFLRVDIPSVGRRNETVLVNFKDIIKTGNIDTGRWHSQHIDFNSDDAFTRALTDVEQAVSLRIETSPELQELLSKTEWDRDDRVAWEQQVSYLVSDELSSIAGLDSYRIDKSSNNPNVGDHLKVAEYRATRLNDLAIDIENGTATIEFDCEAMSAFEGVILQKMETGFLPENTVKGDYKVASNYFYTIGNVQSSVVDSSLGSHAFIMSSATGNVIEATSTSPGLYKASITEYSFEDFLGGSIFYGSDGAAYGAYGIGLNQYDTLRAGNINPEGLDNVKVLDMIPTPHQIERGHEIGHFEKFPIPHEAEQLLLYKKMFALDPDVYSHEAIQGMFDKEMERLAETGEMMEVVDWLQYHSADQMQSYIDAHDYNAANPNPLGLIILDVPSKETSSDVSVVSPAAPGFGN